MEIVQTFTVHKHKILFTQDELEEINQVIKDCTYIKPNSVQAFSELIDNL